MTTTQNPWDVVIVGGGSAGLSAALILARARRRVLVLDAGAPRNRFAAHMHGVLSRDGYSPLDLVADGRREVLAADGVIETALVTGARATPHGFELTTDTGRVVAARRVVVATGLRDDLPPIEGLAEQWGRGVVACPYCDGYEARGLAIGAFAGSALSLFRVHLLRAYSSDVTVFTAGFDGGLPHSDLRALEARGIRIEDRPVARIITDGDEVTGVEFEDGDRLPLGRIFAEGRMVALDGLLRQLGAEMSETPMGPWTKTDASGQTSVAGVWAIGNSANPGALVPVAAASGVVAAVTINAELVIEDIAAAVEVTAA
jgi:thioredoxin reductase